ncbi:MAG: TonB-dependent receptor family protein, partial [Alphaproteobacteria bacterium]
TDADFAANPYRRYNASQLDEMDWERKGFRVGHTVELTPDIDLATVYYTHDFQRNWYKLSKAGAVGLSDILEDPTTHAAAFADIVGASGHVGADDSIEVKANNREYYSQGVQSVLTVEREMHGMQHRIQLSARWHEDEMDRFQWVDKFRMDNGTLVLTTAGVPGEGKGNNRIDSAEAWSFFLQDEITHGAWTFVPGVRFEQIETKRIDFGAADPARTTSPSPQNHDIDIWIPGIGILFEASDQLTLLAGANKGFTPPAPGNTADAEEAWNYEAGARLFLDNGVSAELIGFWSDYDNLVATCTASTGGGCAIGDQFNGDAVTVLGVEAKASGDLRSFVDVPVMLPFWASYTYTDATFDSTFDSKFDGWGKVMAGDHLPYIPEHQLSLGLGAEGDGWAVHGVMSYVDEVRAVAGQGPIPASERIESHTVFDLSGEVALSDYVALTGSVQNVFDSDYAVARRPAGLRPGKPQAFRIGFKADL